MYYHETRTGEKIRITDITDKHLVNIIKFIKKRAKEGVDVYYGGMGTCGEDMWCDKDVLFGEEAEEHLDLSIYINELNRRNLNKKDDN